jgi:xylan 1,4-beta-xylosidase
MLTILGLASAQTRVVRADATDVKGMRDLAYRFCVGSERAGVVLRPANMEQLAQVHRELGFEYIRFHGIFHDDMEAFHLDAGRAVYNWKRIDSLYDKILSLGMKPFVELSFMPHDLASGTQTVFYWKANVTPPKDLSLWSAFIEAFLRHLEERYGSKEVKTWFFEVWNEPNYEGFWPGTNQKAYFDLYDATAAAIKKVNESYRVGGPASAGAAWVPEFIAHTTAAKSPVDFISTHTYAVSSGFLDADGKADLVLSADPAAISGDVLKVRAQIDASAKPHLPLHITEWSASYSSRDPVHDSYTSAAFILDKLKKVDGNAASMSYWTYTDLFEENGPPPAAFHGGFGLLTRDGIPKPAYFSYKYLNELGDVELHASDAQSWVTRTDHGIAALIWDFSSLKQNEGDKAFFRKLHPAEAAAPITLILNRLVPGEYVLDIRRTGFESNDAYSAYIRMGLPTDLSPAQILELQRDASDRPQATRDIRVGENGVFEEKIPLRKNDVVLVTLTRK